ncbi:MAG: UDP-N-acetylmuramate--L-alanine ligase [Longimicrobiales bacterium]
MSTDTRAVEEWMRIDLRALARTGTVHFMGVGGAGMSTIAELLVKSGGHVSGCDRDLGNAAIALKAHGVTLMMGHDAAHVADAAALVITSAVAQDHPEVVTARELGIPVLKRAQALGSIVNQGRVIAISGTHGKTTTTAMTSAALMEAGLDPTGFVGGRVEAWGGGLQVGESSLFVVEADEYDRSFFTLRPHVAVVTSIEADHLDIYGDLAGLEDAFELFLDSVPESGRVIACVDDAGVQRVISRFSDARILRYGTGAAADMRAVDIRQDGDGMMYTVVQGADVLGEVKLRVPGVHNVLNSLAAIAAARSMGAAFEDAARGIAGYQGVARRFERVGIAGDVLFVDDYAHHPTEIEATLSAARSALADRRIVAVFQPHLYSRTRDLAQEFGTALAQADTVWVTDVYAARELPMDGITGETVATAARTAGAKNVTYVADLAELETTLGNALQPGDACIAMGAGDINEAIRRVYSRRLAA